MCKTALRCYNSPVIKTLTKEAWKITNLWPGKINTLPYHKHSRTPPSVLISSELALVITEAYLPAWPSEIPLCLTDLKHKTSSSEGCKISYVSHWSAQSHSPRSLVGLSESLPIPYCFIGDSGRSSQTASIVRCGLEVCELVWKGFHPLPVLIFFWCIFHM